VLHIEREKRLVKKRIDHDKVRAILATYRPALEELAQLLLKKEVVERPELQGILKVV
jgi:ATP-dependent Zn protease